MRILFKLKFCVLLFNLFNPSVQGEVAEANKNSDVNYGSWPIDQFYSTAARYYQSLDTKKLDDQVITLNDLSEVIIDLPENSPESKDGVNKLKYAFARWGKKPVSVVPIYQVVEHGDSEFRRDFKEIFGKSVKYYQCVCATYATNNKSDLNNLRVLDPSGIFSVATFSKLDLWLMDENGKCYVVLSYEVARGFKGNMKFKALEKLGIRDAKLWK